METSMLSTSFYYDKISLHIKGFNIVFDSLPFWLQHSNLMIRVSNILNNECVKNIYQIDLPPCEITIPYLAEGSYFLQILYESTTRNNYYYPINVTEGFPIKILKGNITFVIPETLEINKNFFLNKKTDWLSKVINKSANSLYQCNEPSIVNLANEITKYKTGNYNKILAIHDWVAENMYYDYDALHSGKYRYERYDAMSMLQSRRTVCRGYSKLAVTLLRAIDIPAVDVECFALGESSDGDWSCENNMLAEANHVLTFALATNRWIIMDPTWDSVNEYRNGEYTVRTGGGARHTYFDATLAFFSYTHRFIK